MRIADLIADLHLTPLSGEFDTDRVITEITEDSRAVVKGALFIARQGEKVDGKRFIAQAVASGAAAVLCDDPTLRIDANQSAIVLASRDINRDIARIAERFFGEPSSKLRMIGVTGTNGKTTITFLIHQLLNVLGIKCGLIGTVVIDDGGPTGPRPSELTTPPAIELARTLSRMVLSGCTAAVMEVSSHSLHQHRVGALSFQAGVFTNLTHDHLDYHKTMENYAAAKAMLFAMLPEAAAGGVAVVNADDPWTPRMLQDCRARAIACRVVTETAPRASGGATARVVESGTGSTTIAFAGAWGERTVRVPLVGAFNVMNALQAVATVHALYGGTGEDDLSFEIIARALERVSPPPGRLEPVTGPSDKLSVFVDYAHTDDALRTVLEVLRGALVASKSDGRLIGVFGCGGDRDATKRPKMGHIAGRLADQVVITSDNPRTEDPGAIIRAIQAGLEADAAAKATVEPDRERAIHLAIQRAKPGDVVVIAGKGHEDYQILPDPANPGKTIKRHFDDREVARAALAKRGA